MRTIEPDSVFASFIQKAVAFARKAPCAAWLRSHGRPLRVSASLAALLAISPLAVAQLSVSASGSPHYAAPIAVPPGIAGQQPRLLLAYTAGGNGPIGFGWSLQGVSAITRCPATLATDGQAASVTFGPDDKLCLDGQRLIRIDSGGNPIVGIGTNDASGPSSGTYFEYRTEIDQYARIRAYGIAGGSGSGTTGPAFFKVWTKDGQILEFGDIPSKDANTQALINAQGSAVAMAWALARTSDVVGNHVDYKYVQRDVAWGSGPSSSSAALGHEWNLAEIQYSGNKVVFSYDPSDSRADKFEAYHQGSKNVGLRLLKAITTYINSPNIASLGPSASAVAAKTVHFNYTTGAVTRRSLLSSIQECSGDAASTRCLPSISFTYTAGGGDVYQPSSAFNLASLGMQAAASNVGVITADFNGDGKADFIRWSGTPSQNQLYLSNGDGSFTQVQPTTNGGKFNIIDQNLFDPTGCYVSMAGDFNGDGLPDILRYGSSTVSANGTACAAPGTNILFLNNGDGSFTQKTVAGVTLNRRRSALQNNCLQYFTGTKVCAEYGDWVGWTSGETFYLFDVDGDGKLDIVTAQLPGQAPMATPADPCAGVVCTRVFLGDGQGNFTEKPSNAAHVNAYSDPDNGYAVGSPSHVADLDGDRLSDLVNVGNPWVGLPVSLRSTGNGNFIVAANQLRCIYPIDFNGDGHSDCLFPGSTAAGNLMRASTGLGTQAVANFNLTGTDAVGGTQELAGSVGIRILDIDGDGREDILRWGIDPTRNALYRSNGDGTFTASSTFSLGPNGVNYPLQSSDGTTAFVVADFTGHGNAEILRMQSSGTTAANTLFVKQDWTPPDLLLTVTGGTGATTKLVYVPLSNPMPAAGSGAADLGPRYLSDRGGPNAAQAPSIDLAFPLYVVATKIDDAGVGTSTINSDYKYAGLKVDPRGRGNLGFREVWSQSPGADGSMVTVDTLYSQVHPYIGLPLTQTQYHAGLSSIAAGNSLSSVVNLYCDQAADKGADATALASNASCPTTAKISRPYILRSQRGGKDLNGTALPDVTTQTTVNATGDPLSVVTTTSGSAAGVAQTFKSTTTNAYQADDTSCDAAGLTCKWLLGRVSRSTVSNSVPNSFASIAASAGTSPYATATTGTAEPLQVTAAPAAVSQTSVSSNAVSATTNVSVGNHPTPPLNFSWARIAGATSKVSVSGGAAATFSATLAANETVSETFRATVTDAVGRVGSVDVPVTLALRPAALSVSVSPPSISGTRSSPGAVSAGAAVSLSGGVAPVAVTWSRLSGSRISVSGSTSATFSATLGWGESLSETFRVTATDAVGQVKTLDVPVAFSTPAQPVVSISPSPLAVSRSNPGVASGVLNASASGGLAPFTFAWSRTSGTRSSVSSATAANPSMSATLGWAENFTETWTVTATDSAGNTAQASVNVVFTSPPQPVVTVSPTSLLVNRNNPGVGSGAVVASASSGTPPFTYSWVRTAGTRSSISNSAVANPTFSANLAWAENFTDRWQVTVQDAQGNANTASVDVTFTTPAQPTVSLSPTSLTLSRNSPGVVSGTVAATVSGGVAPYTYAWVRLTGSRSSVSNSTASAPAISATLSWSESFSETWQVTCTDAAGNTVQSSVSVSFATPAQPSVSVSPASLNLTRNNPGTASGTVSANATGGVTPYAYSWQRTSGSRSSVSSATVAQPSISATLGWGDSFTETWKVTVTDAAGNTAVSSVSVGFAAPAQPTIGVSPSPLVVNASSSGVASGVATATSAGGVPPFTYGWSRLSGSRTTVSSTTSASPTISATLGLGENFTETWQVTATDAASNAVSASVNVTFTSPAPPSLAISPSSFAYGNLGDGVAASTTFTVTNSGGSGTFSQSLTVNNAGDFRITGTTCPANGAVLASNSSCTITASFTGHAQCGGTVVTRTATLAASAGPSSASASLSGQNHVYSLTDPHCR
jgi:hypothetical protein